MEKEKIIYAGIFLDEKSSRKLEDLIPDWIKSQSGYKEIRDRHMTIFFHTNMPQEFVKYMERNDGKLHYIEIDGVGISKRVISARVKSCQNVDGEKTPSTNSQRHITLATFNGGKTC